MEVSLMAEQNRELHAHRRVTHFTGLAGIEVSALRHRELTAESFRRLLEWLDPDLESAGKRYEQIRSQLIRIFVCRGCLVPEDLADETFNRVAGKLPQIETGYVGDPALYFYGVAAKIFLEYTRRQVARHAPAFPAPNQPDQRFPYLEQCIEALSPEHRQMVLDYYGDSERGKAQRRKALAELAGLGKNALCIRVHRIRAVLKRCVEERIGQIAGRGAISMWSSRLQAKEND
jgi:DNA-directed RNA polymerase specialized sigma24 family protein